MSKSEPLSRKIRRVPVSALFDKPEAVQAALERLNAAGLPRDLVDVAVAPAGAKRFYGGRGRRTRRDTFRYAAIGGLIGLVFGAVFTFVLVALPGFQEPGVMAWAQFLGPNVGTITGSFVGAVFGYFVRRKPDPWHVRLDQAGDAILVTALVQGPEAIETVFDVLAGTGGHDVQVGLPRAKEENR